MFSQDFRKDLDALLGVLRDQDAPAIALARFHDGEHALLRGRKYKAVSGWVGDGSKSWIVKPLLDSLRCRLPGYHVGFSDITTLPDAYGWYVSQVKVPRPRFTFATLFQYANHAKSLAYFKANRDQFVLVGCNERCDIRVPANASKVRFDVERVVDEILDARKPAILAAGPAACLIAHRYWERTVDLPEERKHVIDVGAAIDPMVHGKPTRNYHEPNTRMRRFVPKWSKRQAFMTDTTGKAVPTRARVREAGQLPNHNASTNVRVRPSSSDPTSEHRKTPSDAVPPQDEEVRTPSFMDNERAKSENIRGAGPRLQRHTRRRR